MLKTEKIHKQKSTNSVQGQWKSLTTDWSGVGFLDILLRDYKSSKNVKVSYANIPNIGHFFTYLLYSEYSKYLNVENTAKI